MLLAYDFICVIISVGCVLSLHFAILTGYHRVDCRDQVPVQRSDLPVDLDRPFIECESCPRCNVAASMTDVKGSGHASVPG